MKLSLQLGIAIVVFLGVWLDTCDARPRRNHPNRHHPERGPGGRNHLMPTPASDKMDMDQIKSYFEKYHYMGHNCPSKELGELAKTNESMAIREATKMFQSRYSRYGLRETGELDEATIDLMSKPRCGVPDLMSMADMMKRKKRYLLSNERWETNDLTYRISQYPTNDLGPSEVNQEIARAFQVWEQVTPLRFHMRPYGSYDHVDIDIKFVISYYDHGDGYPFDGPSGNLAHAFFPHNADIAGDTHFDDAEQWTIGSYQGYNLFQVAAHEFGHALGLGHSMDPTALMAPFYPGYQPSFTLPKDDETGIQIKYGGPVRPSEPQPSTTTPKSKPETPDNEDICESSSFDAITTILQNNEYQTYGFKGRHYFLIDAQTGSLASGYPRLISEGWPGLPDNVDAALFHDRVWEWSWDEDNQKWVQKTTKQAKTYVFKGDQYWEVSDMSVTGGPHSISNDWGVAGDIDAAFVWRTNGKTYFIKGDQYYRYTPQSGADSGYPRPLSTWGDLPSHIDAAMQYTNEQTFFFSGSQFWAYNDAHLRVEANYPRDSHGYWFRC